MSMVINPFVFGEQFPAPTTIFSSDLMLSSTWHQGSYPPAFYDSNEDKTYVCWQFGGLAGHKGVHIAAYDHATSTWGERYTVGNFLLADDDHGYGSIIRDADGYIHCLFGSHNSAQSYSVTNNPDDISSWTQRPSFGTVLTYPTLAKVGSVLYLFMRFFAGGSKYTIHLSTMTPVAGVGTWAASTPIIDFGASSRVYRSEAHVVGTDIHFTCTFADGGDTFRENVYYFIYDTTTGSLKNYNGTTTVTSGSFPVSLATADASFKIYDHGASNGDMASLQFDSSGNAHVLFADYNGSDYDLKHMMLSGGSWSSATTIAQVSDLSPSFGYVDTYCLVPGASGKMEAWYNVSGDKVRRIRSASGTWGSPKIIKAAGTNNFVSGIAVRDADPELRTLFAENTTTATDSSAALTPFYAYGDSGPVNAAIDMSAVDTAGFSNVVMLLGGYHRDGGARIIDESNSSVVMTFTGNAQIDTAQTPFAGRASLLLDGTGDYLTALNNSAYSVAGTSDFCIDGFFRRGDTGRQQVILTKRSSGGAGEGSLLITTANQLAFNLWNGTTVVLSLVSSSTVTTGTWYYYEVSRIAGVTYLFLGTLGGSTTLQASGTQSSTPTTTSQAMLIGRDPGFTTRDFNGWLAETRFTRAGRHTTGFTVPTAPFPRR